MNRNPYQPTSNEPAKQLKGIRWHLRFAILNCVLLLVPVICALAAYFALAANGIHLSGVSGVMGTELAILLMAYFGLPNSIMFALLFKSRYSSRRETKTKLK